MDLKRSISPHSPHFFGRLALASARWRWRRFSSAETLRGRTRAGRGKRTASCRAAFRAKAAGDLSLHSGGPSQSTSFDYKTKAARVPRQQLPASIRMGQRLTGMTSGRLPPLRAPMFDFKQHGQSGTWVEASCCRIPPGLWTTCA